MTGRGLESHVSVHAGAARVTLRGELDFDTVPRVRDAVGVCLAERPTSLCLDLTDLSFCDCAGLNALLSARLSVLLSGAEFVVRGIGPQLTRLLDLIGAMEVLADGKARGADAVPTQAGRGARPAPPGALGPLGRGTPAVQVE